MKTNINLMMLVLLVVFLASFITLIIYGEIWRIRLLTDDTIIESFDPARTQVTFAASLISIASGASMLYMFEIRFSQNSKEKN
jgi:hypothetical protein